MEYSLGSVSTIVRIAQDIKTAVETVNRNKSRCKKLQKRVQGISDVLREAGTTSAAIQKLLDRLQDALARALGMVKLCQGRSCPINFIAGGRMAEQFDELDGEIDRCLLDLGAANHVIIARLEKQLHQNVAGSTETVTIRIGMPCDDSAEKIKNCIGTMQGVTEVAAGAANKDQFMVTVRTGDVDISSLLDKVQQKLNRNVELVAPAATAKDATVAGVKKQDVKDQDKKANRKSEGVEDRSDRQRHSSRSDTGAETKEEKATAKMVGVNQQAPTGPFVYMPFKVELVPVGDASSMYQAPSQHGFVAYAYAAPGRVPVHAQQQSNLHRVHFKDASVNNYDSGCYTKDTMMEADKDENKGKFADDHGVDKDEKKGKVAGDGEWKDWDDTTAAGNVKAIGVPVHRHRGMPELVPPPSYGHGYWPYAADCRITGGCYHHNAGGPSDGAAAHGYNHHSPYPDYFCDENPNACSIM